jgi:4-azaleucine resistance transporter AzlC
MNSFKAEFRVGFADMLPMLVAYVPIAMLWGTLAAGKGFSPLEALAMSSLVYTGAGQFMAVDMWREPLPIALLVVTTLGVSLRHVLMSASIARHISGIRKFWHPFMMYVLTDEAWAIAERRALVKPLTLGYFIGVAVPLWPTWFLSSALGAFLGKALGDPTVIGLDFAFAAMFITVLAGFWKGPRTGAVIAASAIAAILGKLFLSGAWYIMLGGLAGVSTAVFLHGEREE